MKNKLVKLYKKTKDLEVKRNLLKFLNNKYISLSLYSDSDYQTECMLMDLYTLYQGKLNMRYGRNYNSIIFELI